MVAISTRRATTLVWIDARKAIIVRGVEGEDAEPSVERLESEVPAHHRSTGQVRHVPTIRHGGGGAAQTAEEPHRLEHLARFVKEVAARVPDEDHALILGPGTVREHLEHEVREMGGRRSLGREVTCVPASRLTERQLVARLRDFVGVSPKRVRVGPERIG